MDLIAHIKVYLEKCSTDSSFTETQQDSFISAFECLETALEDHAEEIAVDLDLGEIWEKIQKKRSQPKPAATATKAGKTWDEFLEMVSTQKGGMFFKDMAIGGSKYVERLKVAKEGYLKHWPNGTIPDLDPTPTEEEVAEAEALKKQGNKLLQGGHAEGAVEKYTEAIFKNRHNAIYFSNRSFGHNRLGDNEKAVLDAEEAIELNSSYIKAYNRLGTAHKALGNTEEAIEAFEKVISLSPATSASIAHCEKQISELRGNNQPQMPDLSNIGNLLSGLGGASGGPGGFDLGSLMKNPAMQQMAQKMMSDPNAMSQMQGMMQNPDFMSNMSNMMGGSGSNMADLMGQMGKEDPNTFAKIQEVLSDPERKEEIIGKVLADPDVAGLRADPEVGPLLDRLQAQDMSAMTELMGKPEVFGQLQNVIKKYI